jgi:hypothetical protein
MCQDASYESGKRIDVRVERSIPIPVLGVLAKALVAPQTERAAKPAVNHQNWAGTPNKPVSG